MIDFENGKERIREPWTSNPVFLTYQQHKVDIFSGGSRIFPEGVRQLPKVLLFFNFFAENCMKMKKIWTPRGARVPGAPLDPPMLLSVNYFFPSLSFCYIYYSHLQVWQKILLNPLKNYRVTE